MTKNVRRKTSKKQDSPQLSAKQLQDRMKMLGFVRSKDSFMELLLAMQTIERELAASYQTLRTLESGSQEESFCMAEVRQLEDRRFQLLSELHGNRVNNYLLSGL